MMIPFDDQGSRKIGKREKRKESTKKRRSCSKRREHRERVDEQKVGEWWRGRREGEVEVIRGAERRGERGPTCNYPV